MSQRLRPVVAEHDSDVNGGTLDKFWAGYIIKVASNTRNAAYCLFFEWCSWVMDDLYVDSLVWLDYISCGILLVLPRSVARPSCYLSKEPFTSLVL